MHHTKFLNIFTIGLIVISLLIPLSVGWSQDNNEDEEDEIPFDVVDIFFELNNTDGDLGIHSLIDGEPWVKIEMKDPKDRRMMVVRNRGRLAKQGLTELFFESAEPTFDEFAPEQFFKRFPEGIYEVEGLTVEGEELDGEAEVTHVMPAPPGNIVISGEAAAEDCDSDLPVVSQPLVITWDPVTTSHPEIGTRNIPVTLTFYEVVVESDGSVPLKATFELPPDRTSVKFPADFFPSGDEVKLEILANESSGNRTATETCFEIQ